MPSFDAGELSLIPFIRRAIESILHQSFTNLELIIVDDGCLRETKALLKEISQNDPRVRIITHEKNQGVVAAMESGMAVARASIIARMDADDISRPDRLQKQYDCLIQNPALHAFSCQIEIRGTESDPTAEPAGGYQRFVAWQNTLVSHEQIFADRFVELPLCNPTMMIRREVYDKVGGYRKFKGPEDFDFWLRFFEAGYHVEKIPEVLHTWQDHPQRLTRQKSEYAQGRFIDTKVRYLARLPEIIEQGVWLIGSGRIARLVARGLKQNGISIRGFFDVAEKNIGRKIQGSEIYPDSALPDLDRRQPQHHGILLLCVGGEGRRQFAETWLEEKGYSKGKDYLAVT